MKPIRATYTPQVRKEADRGTQAVMILQITQVEGGIAGVVFVNSAGELKESTIDHFSNVNVPWEEGK